MGKSHVALPIAVQELDLEPCPVKVVDVTPGKRPVGSHVDLPGLSLLVLVQIVGYNDFADALQAFHPHLAGVQDDSLAILVNEGLACKDITGKVVQVNAFTEYPFAASWLLRAGVHVLQTGVVMQPADKVKSHGIKAFQERTVGKEGVCNNVRSNGTEAFSICFQRVQIDGKQAVRLLERFEILRLGATPLRTLDSLDRLEVNSFLGVCIDKGDTEYLQTPLRGSCAAGPEVSHTGCLLARLTDVSRIDGDGGTLHTHTLGELHVEPQPVERLPEVLAETALTGVRNPGHGRVVYFSEHNDVQNHGLDDEIAKRFV